MINHIFNEVGMAIQHRFRFIPILAGDFALQKRLNITNNANEIRMLIPDIYLDKHWQRICNLMILRSFTENTSMIHSFSRNGITVSFASIEEFVNMTGISTKKLPREFSTFTYYLPDLSQFLTYYNLLLSASTNDAEKTKQNIEEISNALKLQTIKKIKTVIKNICETEHLPKDYTHYVRVSDMSRKLAGELGANEFVCVLSALLYDVNTLNTGNGCKYQIDKLLKNEFVSEDELRAIVNTIDEVRYKNRCKTMESKCLSDACNLDYFGAVGIAITFAEYGKKQLPMYPLDFLPVNTKEDVFSEGRDTLEHFYSLMQNYRKMFYSETAKKMVKDRIEFMQDFLYRFYDECEGIL